MASTKDHIARPPGLPGADEGAPSMQRMLPTRPAAMIRRMTDENASLVDHARSEASTPARILRRRDLISG
jgi:hypothetical protein